MEKILSLFALVLLLASAALAQSNLLVNSSFDFGPDVGGFPHKWAVASMPGGASLVPDPDRARTGDYSLRFTCPDEAALDWFQVRQEITSVLPGRAYTLSAYAQAEEVHDGVGVYCSINCYRTDGERIANFDSQPQLTGTSTDWTRLEVTGTVPEGTAKVAALVLLYGHGVAWVDDVQFEQASAASQYAPAPEDMHMSQQRAALAAEAATFFAAQQPPMQGQTAVAVLRDEFVTSGTPTDPERLAGWLAEAGYAPYFLTGEQLANPYLLRGPAANLAGSGWPFAVLVLPYGDAFPAPAVEAFKGFLQQGGAFFSMGGYTFDSLQQRWEGKWLPTSNLPAPDSPLHYVVDFEAGLPAGYSLGHDGAGKPGEPALSPGPEGQGQGLDFAARPMGMWATFDFPVEGQLPVDWQVTRFWAKGDALTPWLAFEWVEEDGSRWRTKVRLSTEWQQYTLYRQDLSYWDSQAPGRGGPGDLINPAQVARCSVAVDASCASPNTPQHFWFDSLAVQTDPLADLRGRQASLNTREGDQRDALYVNADQIGVFDSAHPLEFATEAVPARLQYVTRPEAAFAGPFEGLAAVGVISNQGHGFGPNLARLIPLLETRDRFGRPRGALGSLMHTWSGFYKGASWAFFGATNSDLFGPESTQGRALFLATLEALVKRCYLHDTTAGYSAYKPGEELLFKTSLVDFGQEDFSGSLRLEVFPDWDGLEAASKPAVSFSHETPVTLTAGGERNVEVSWTPPGSEKASFYYFVFTLLEDGKPIDAEENGLVVTRLRPELQAQLITSDGAYFRLGDRPSLLLGSQSYWGQNGSVTARSPLKFERDYRTMQDMGLHISRLFVPFKTEEDRRQSDAMVQLAEQHRIVFYHAVNNDITADAAQLAAQLETSVHLGERYRNNPWVLVDVRNEPTFGLTTPGQKEGVNAWLSTKYQTDAALRAAWQEDSLTLGQVEPKALDGGWDDIPTPDTHQAWADLQKAWAENTRDGVRLSDPERLVAVGWMQRFATTDRIWANRYASEEMDFNDTHFYGAIPDYHNQVKEIDLRALGKPFLVGECGARNHPTFLAAGGGAETDADYARRFLALGHYVFGLGGTALDTWHWRDPMEGTFPFGQVHQDLVPRASATGMRAQAFAFGQLEPVYKQPEVLVVFPTAHQWGGGEQNAIIDAVRRCFSLLSDCQVDIGVIDEQDLGQLPQGVKALFYPTPWCASDEVIAQLQAFVEAGGVLYCSGELSYDAQRNLAGPERMQTLMGLERVGEHYPHFQRQDATSTPITWTAEAGDLGTGTVNPASQWRLAGAEALATTDTGEPVVTRVKLGQGQVIFSADPIEASFDPQAWYRPFYLAVLKSAGIQRNTLSPDTADVRCFRLPLLEGGEAYVLYNQRAESRTVSLTTSRGTVFDLTLAPLRPGLLVQDAAGNLVQVEAQGPVMRDGQQLLSITGHAFVIALDGKDLAASQQLLIAPVPGDEWTPPSERNKGQPLLRWPCRQADRTWRTAIWRLATP